MTETAVFPALPATPFHEITFDAQADALYARMFPHVEGQDDFESCIRHPDDYSIGADLDSAGRVIGVEIIHAKHHFPHNGNVTEADIRALPLLIA